VPLLADAVVEMAVATAAEPQTAVTPVPPAQHLAAMATEPVTAVLHLAAMATEPVTAVPHLAVTATEPVTAVPHLGAMATEPVTAVQWAMTAATVETPERVNADAVAAMVAATLAEPPAAATPVPTAPAELATVAAHQRDATMHATLLS